MKLDRTCALNETRTSTVVGTEDAIYSAQGKGEKIFTKQPLLKSFLHCEVWSYVNSKTYSAIILFNNFWYCGLSDNGPFRPKGVVRKLAIYTYNKNSYL